MNIIELIKQAVEREGKTIIHIKETCYVKERLQKGKETQVHSQDNKERPQDSEG